AWVWPGARRPRTSWRENNNGPAQRNRNPDRLADVHRHYLVGLFKKQGQGKPRRLVAAFCTARRGGRGRQEGRRRGARRTKESRGILVSDFSNIVGVTTFQSSRWAASFFAYGCCFRSAPGLARKSSKSKTRAMCGMVIYPNSIIQCRGGGRSFTCCCV